MSPGTSRLVSTTVSIDPEPAAPVPVAPESAATSLQKYKEKVAAELAARDEKANKELAVRFDALNQALAASENVLKALKPPYSVFIWYDHEDSGECQMLGMMKLNDQWRLVHGFDHEDNDTGSSEIKPLIERPVEVRVRAAGQLQDLKERIVETKEKYIPEVDQAILQAQQFLAANTLSKPTKK